MLGVHNMKFPRLVLVLPVGKWPGCLWQLFCTISGLFCVLLLSVVSFEDARSWLSSERVYSF